MGPKKPKKTKAELEAERLLQEEEEKKQKALEEKRLAEEAEKRRQEEARIKAQRVAFREAEIARLNTEFEDLVSFIDLKERQKNYEDLKMSDELEWESYRNPSDEPDSQSESDMNTFISTVEETNSYEFSDSLPIVQKIVRIARNMENVWSDSVCLGDINSQRRSAAFLEKFTHLIYHRLDIGTANALRFVDNYLNDKYEINIEESIDGVSLGIWASFNDIRPIRKSIQFESLGVQLDIPKQVLQQDTKFCHRIIKIPFETFSLKAFSDSSSPGLRNNLVLGDVYHFDILTPPAQAYSIRAKKWIIRDNSSAAFTLKKYSYPSSVASRCFLRVPPTVVMSEDIRIALWDEEKQDWTEEGLSDFQYSESNRIVQFYMTVVGTVALIRNRSVDFPYRRWSMQPICNKLDPDHPNFGQHVRLTVGLAKIEVVIDIIGTKCKLVKPTLDTLADLVGIAMTPGQLLIRLQRHGINLFPSYWDNKLVENNVTKNELLEDDVLLALARCASSLEYKNSTWNKELPTSQIGIQVRESTAYLGNADTYDYECVLAELDSCSESARNAPDVGSIRGKSGVKYTLVLGNEYGDKRHFSHTPRPNEITHVDFLKSLTSRLTEESVERIKMGNERFHQTVYNVLKLLKPCSF